MRTTIVKMGFLVIPWWLRIQVQSLVGELKSHSLCSAAKEKKTSTFFVEYLLYNLSTFLSAYYFTSHNQSFYGRN